AEDLAQEAFVRLWQRLGELEIGAAGVWPWLRRVIFNLAMDRRRARRDTSPDALEFIASEDDPQFDAEARDLGRHVAEALGDLPERQRFALVMFHYEGCSMKDIADLLETNDRAVESLLARARRTLRTTLADDWQALLPDARAATQTGGAGEPGGQMRGEE
ncbi:MAG: sigma-70 family RNA polymerase sigma factor, partial [Pseudomonadota bacterium]